MKTTSAIESVFGTPGKIRILRALAKAPRPLTGRQVAELSGLTHRGAIQAMAGLVDAGVVRQRQVGRAYQYELSRDNMLVERIVLAALDAEASLPGQLRTELVEGLGARAVSVVLFGSVARGEESARSDIDVLAVVDTAEAKTEIEGLVDSRASLLEARLGHSVSVHVLTIPELRKRPRPAFLEEVLRDGVLLKGTGLEELIQRGA